MLERLTDRCTVCTELTLLGLIPLGKTWAQSGAFCLNDRSCGMRLLRAVQLMSLGLNEGDPLYVYIFKECVIYLYTVIIYLYII